MPRSNLIGPMGIWCVFFSLLLVGCAEAPPKIQSLGDAGFKDFAKAAYSHPSSSFRNFQFCSAMKGDDGAIKSIFNQALYDARNPLLPGSDEEADQWTTLAVLYSIGEDRFLAVLSHEYAEVQRAVLGPLSHDMIGSSFPKVSKLRDGLLAKP